MKKWISLWLLGTAATVMAGNVPNQITYQGTLKEAGVPVNGTRNMQFRLTNANGTAVYWSGTPFQVNITQGLFAAVLTPTGVDWENIAPFIEVSIEGQLLQPREAVTSTAYALSCGSVVNETGMIAMFTGNCPAGWNRFTALDGLFPRGGAAYGATGGSATHNHGGKTGAPNAEEISDAGHNFLSPTGHHTHSIAMDSNIPPYLMMVFCQKQ